MFHGLMDYSFITNHIASGCVKRDLPLGSGTSGWQNSGPFVWQREEIGLVFANRSCIGY